MHKLSVAFPQMSQDFFNILAERIVRLNISSQRLEYAINRVLDTFTYKQLTIADVLSIDVKCKILTYAEMCAEISKKGGSMDDYTPVKVRGSKKPGWVLKIDKAKFNIPDEI